MRGIVVGLVLVLPFWAGACLAVGYAQTRHKADEERQKLITLCIEMGGIPVPVAGVISSQGIGCAAPLNDGWALR